MMNRMIVSENDKKELQRRLLAWFRKKRRPMPWRQTSDPYRIWVSEIMLQQTQVAAAEPYYHKFIKRFPDVKSLAEADIHDVMKTWEGLGYYSRARNLHKTAAEIMDRFSGRVPDNLADLLSLPGIGRYTAGAIMSIAFGKPAPVLDGNVIRVLTRIFHITDNIQQSATLRILWSLAEQLIPQDQIREFNESMMELGAVVCKPKQPECSVCPAAALCAAFTLELQESLPVRPPKKPVPHIHVTAGIIWKNDTFLITLRPPKGLLGGLWEFPGGKVERGETLEACLVREIMEELHLQVDVEKKLISVRHAYTHFRITLHAFKCRYKEGMLKMDPDSAVDYRWITADELELYAFPGADRKVIGMLQKSGSGL